MRTLLLSALAALSACATPLPQIVVRGSHDFDIRYDNTVSNAPAIDEQAQARCPGAVLTGEGQRYDGFAYRSYRCPNRLGDR
ncbi:MAG: hypothetical protein AB7P07_02350 [Hyphomonadaceae bacterium]